MNTLNRKAPLVLATALLLASCSPSQTAEPAFVPDTDTSTIDLPGDSIPVDESLRTDLDSDEDSTIPAKVGQPCDDRNPCTTGETVQTDGTCSGGQTWTCDDGRECTLDQCTGNGDCLFSIKPDACLINGICYQQGPGQCPELCCAECDPLVSQTQWTGLPAQTPCDDADACTEDDVCSEDGQCWGQISDCSDDNPCTTDSCHPDGGCLHLDAEGQACELDDACVAWAICEAGQCVAGDSTDCDDNQQCTADSCSSPEGCIHAPLDGLKCSDGDICTVGDTCEADTCAPGPELLDCSDGNECTSDLCHPISGCYHELNQNPCCNDSGVNMCDDGNWCTVDKCKPDTGECFYEFNSLPCDDQDPCTGPDLCLEGACQSLPVDCDDSNPCTVDQCDPAAGCQQVELDDQPCDDGLECSTADACVAGQCVADLSACNCQPVFHPAVNKLNTLAIGSDGHPGSGLDVDIDPATCSPKDKCSQGVDNSLSMFGDLAGDALQKAVTDGQVILIFEHRDFSPSGQPYSLAFYIGEAADPDCDLQTQTCPYLVKADSFDDQCNSIISLDNASVAGTWLSAGGPGYNFPLPLPLSEGVILDLTLYNAQVAATLVYEDGLPASMDGILAGAVPKQTLLDALNAVPEDQLPVDKALVETMLNLLVTNDIDSDGDGSLDAASIGLPFTAVAATISGVE